VDAGLLYLIVIDAVKGKKISIFLQIWTRKCVYILALVLVWHNLTIPKYASESVNALGVQILNFQNTFNWLGLWRDYDGDTDRKFLRKPNLNEITPFFFVWWQHTWQLLVYILSSIKIGHHFGMLCHVSLWNKYDLI
jgi:hypothetical protein